MLAALERPIKKIFDLLLKSTWFLASVSNQVGQDTKLRFLEQVSRISGLAHKTRATCRRRRRRRRRLENTPQHTHPNCLSPVVVVVAAAEAAAVDY